jgi:uncharacterized alkaline shock family protein YloU
MDAEPLISPDVLARYAGDAARDVPGVAGLAESPRHRGKAVVVGDADGALDVTVHVELEWGRSVADVGQAVQDRVRDYVEGMTHKAVGTVEVVVDGVTAPPA